MSTAAPGFTGFTAVPAAADERAGRIEAHVRVVEQVLHRQLDELSRSWDEIDGQDVAGGSGPDLPSVLLDVLDRGGKRTRPVMTYLGWIAGGGHKRGNGYADAVRASAAVEMLHAFALVHDDLMDESSLRRGRPTIHADATRRHAAGKHVGGSDRYGESVALLAGDLAHAEADAMAATLPAPMRRIWQRLVLELVAGQHWDLDGSAAADRRVPFARAVARQKTGNYTVARPLQLGAAAAGASTAALDALARFGQHAGEAFALRDELLGAFGNPRDTGKPAGDDLRAGKPTVLLAVASARVTGSAAVALAAAGSPAMTDLHVITLQQAMLDLDVVADVERMVDERVADAVAALDTDVLNADGVTELSRTVDSLARRRR